MLPLGCESLPSCCELLALGCVFLHAGCELLARGCERQVVEERHLLAKQRQGAAAGCQVRLRHVNNYWRQASLLPKCDGKHSAFLRLTGSKDNPDSL